MNGLQIFLVSIVLNAVVLGIVVWLTYELNRLVKERGRSTWQASEVRRVEPC